MALEIPLDPHDTGSPAAYWRITQAHVDHLHDVAVVWLHGWRDAAARLDKRAPAASLMLHLNSADMPGGTLHDADTATLYAALKARAAAPMDMQHPLGTTPPAMLADATDC